MRHTLRTGSPAGRGKKTQRTPQKLAVDLTPLQKRIALGAARVLASKDPSYDALNVKKRALIQRREGTHLAISRVNAAHDIDRASYQSLTDSETTLTSSNHFGSERHQRSSPKPIGSLSRSSFRARLGARRLSAPVTTSSPDRKSNNFLIRVMDFFAPDRLAISQARERGRSQRRLVKAQNGADKSGALGALSLGSYGVYRAIRSRVDLLSTDDTPPKVVDRKKLRRLVSEPTQHPLDPILEGRHARSNSRSSAVTTMTQFIDANNTEHDEKPAEHPGLYMLKSANKSTASRLRQMWDSSLKRAPSSASDMSFADVGMPSMMQSCSRCGVYPIGKQVLRHGLCWRCR